MLPDVWGACRQAAAPTCGGWGPLMTPPHPGKFLERVAKHSRVEGECVLWTRCLAGRGTPQIRWRYKHYSVATAVYEIRVGPVLDGFTVRRICRNPRCIKVSHLRPFTSKGWGQLEETRRRARAAGRASMRAGRQVPARAVAAIRAAKARGESLGRFYRKYGQVVYGIANGFIYRDDDLPAPARGTVGRRRS